MEQTLQSPLEDVKAIETLVPYLEDKEKNIMSYAVQALNYLCSLNEDRLLIGIKNDIIPKLITLIKNSTANLKEFAYNIILKVSPYISKMECVDIKMKYKIIDQVIPIYIDGLNEPSFSVYLLLYIRVYHLIQFKNVLKYMVIEKIHS